MKNIAIGLTFLIFLLPAQCLAQYPKLTAFKSDPKVSGQNGDFIDTLNDYFLYKMQEPILSNYYLNKEVYRLTLTSGIIGKNIIIKIEKSADSISITTKELHRTHKPDNHRIYEKKDWYDLFDLNYTTKPLDKRSYNMFINLLDTFFTRPLTADRIGLDGSTWILEISTGQGYYCEKKWSPRKGDPVKEIGDLLIDLSDLKHKRSMKKF